MKLYELKSPVEITTLEHQLDSLMRPVGLDVEFSRHFIERLLGRERQVTILEILDAFTKLKRKYKKKLLNAKRNPGYTATLKDFDNDLNIAFGIKVEGETPQLVNITIKRKDPNEFGTDNYPGSEVLIVGRKR